MNHKLLQGDCYEILGDHPQVDCIMADPPDNIGLKYASYNDNKSTDAYEYDLYKWLKLCVFKAPTVWLSFNARWTVAMGRIASQLQSELSWLSVKPCVQYFTFFQQNPHDLGNAHRPCWRFTSNSARLYPKQILVPSWRQLNGDPRANPEGCVPGDVFDIPRVTGNSHQRRAWHPTQLNESLVTRCIKLCTVEGDTVLDPFAGTGTTLRVCKGINRNSVSVELDPDYCRHIVQEHGMIEETPRQWFIPEKLAWWDQPNVLGKSETV